MGSSASLSSVWMSARRRLYRLSPRSQRFYDYYVWLVWLIGGLEAFNHGMMDQRFESDIALVDRYISELAPMSDHDGYHHYGICVRVLSIIRR